LGEKEMMMEIKCSMIEIVYNSPELKSCPIEATFKIIGKNGQFLS
jgi:hypothetical protein